jgi:adenylyltransferase/sulfurtransferase
MSGEIDRYSRQVLLPGIGPEGQKRLANSLVALIGCGALGTVIATTLARAGVGRLRIVDRDIVEYHNLQRQVIFDEDDARDQLPKAAAAERHLRKVNSTIEIEGVVADVNYANIEKLIRDANVILDGLDNFETRCLVNDASLKHGIPWIYGGAVSTYGMTMNVIPGQTPCFRCIHPQLPAPGTLPTCDTAGVIATAPFVIGSLQSTEAMKLLVGARDPNRDLVSIDVWTGEYFRYEIERRPDCPTCHGKYDFLEARSGTRTTSLCGRDTVQVFDPEASGISLDALASRLQSIGAVRQNEYMLRFEVDGSEIVVFPDGRALIKTGDESVARGLYAKYVGI